MCGRFYRISDLQTVADAFHAESADAAFSLAPAYNIAPATIQPVIRQNRETFSCEIVPMRWGLVGNHSTGPDPKRSTFNARSDSLERSSLWRVPFHRQRCLIPLNGWYECHRPSKAVWRFALHDELFAAAGVWDAWKNPADCRWLQSFAIITVPANEVMSSIHDRMPAVLHPSDYDRWLDRKETEQAPLDLLLPFESTAMRIFAANPLVLNIRNQGPEVLHAASTGVNSAQHSNSFSR
jgi:putative SOS response-associated peptidase YedK